MPQQLSIVGPTLHRPFIPFAQEALGHNSKAMHRAYAKKAKVKIPALEDFERKRAEELKAIALPE